MKPLIKALVLSVFLTLFTVSAQAQVAASGRITLLRVHDVGTGYGPPADFIDVEVIVLLDTQPGKAFGFQLRNDGNRVARQGQLDLLRDAFNNNWTVTVDHITPAGRQNGVIIRTQITK